MSDTATLPNPVLSNRCAIEEIIEAPLIELLQLVPLNPLVRALILKQTGKMPGAECATFEQLQEWVETHCEKKARSVNRPTRPGLEGGIRISVEFSETEYGRAHYSVPRWGTEEFRVGAEDLLNMVQDVIDSGGDIDEVVDLVAEKIDDDAWSQCDPSMDNYGDYDYSEHDSTDSSDSSTEYSKDAIRNTMRRFLRDQHPALLEELE